VWSCWAKSRHVVTDPPDHWKGHLGTTRCHGRQGSRPSFLVSGCNGQVPRVRSSAAILAGSWPHARGIMPPSNTGQCWIGINDVLVPLSLVGRCQRNCTLKNLDDEKPFSVCLGRRFTDVRHRLQYNKQIKADLAIEMSKGRSIATEIVADAAASIRFVCAGHRLCRRYAPVSRRF
jgi:hypothetical protein